ncbi:hypothetical protein L7F22_021143 [Adiantum nelumboides]|nr:hypothetical protein [Adiantum nelumboides]
MEGDFCASFEVFLFPCINVGPSRNCLSRSQIEKLTGSNYLPWSLRLQMVLEKAGNLGLVDGSKANPAIAIAGQAPAPQATIDAWNKKDLEARTEITLHLGDKQLQLVRQTKTAKEMWTVLKQQYQRTNVVSRVLLHKQLNELTMKVFPSTDVFLDAWQKANDDLLIAGLVLPEEIQVTILLAALPDDWQSFITTHSTNSTLTVNELLALIRQEDLLRGKSTATNTHTSMSMAAGGPVTPGPAPPPQPAQSPGVIPTLATPARDFVFQETRPATTRSCRQLHTSHHDDPGLTYVSYPSQRRISSRTRGMSTTNRRSVSYNSSSQSPSNDNTQTSASSVESEGRPSFLSGTNSESESSQDSQHYRNISDIMRQTRPSQALAVHYTKPNPSSSHQCADPKTSEQSLMLADETSISVDEALASEDEDIYMIQPPHFVDPQHPDHVCHLQRSLYGLKQSPRQWNARFTDFMLRASFQRCVTDVSVYARHGDDGLLALALYVDDIVLIAPSVRSITRIKQELFAEFSMTDGGEILYILGIRILTNRPHTLTLEQSRFAKNILTKFNVSTTAHTHTPLPIRIWELYPQSKTGPARWTHTKECQRYRSIFGSIRYLVSCTRPDLRFAAGILSRFMHNPKPVHHQHIKSLLHYIANTDGNHNLSVYGFTDADLASDLLTRLSTGGYVFMLAGAAISWRSKRQSTVAASSCEAEYRAATDAAKEAIWIGNFLRELNFEVHLPHAIYCDSMAAIDASKKPKQSEKLKHLDIQDHFIRQKVEDETINLIYINTIENAADFLTKSLQTDKHQKCCSMIGMEV